MTDRERVKAVILLERDRLRQMRRGCDTPEARAALEEAIMGLNHVMDALTD